MTNTVSKVSPMDSIWRWWLGLKRFFQILIGWQAQSSHEAAAHGLMVIGFIVEWYVLSEVALYRVHRDLGENDVGAGIIRLFIPVIIVLLLFHQFLIFRNFALPKEREHRDLKQLLVEAVRRGEAPDSIEKLIDEKLGAGSGSDRRIRSYFRKGLEVFTYGLFGVLTGEAGYMLTVMHEHNQQNAITVFFSSLFASGVDSAWSHTLEGVFLVCAIAICLCVLIWDGMITLVPSDARTSYEGRILTFWLNDIFSCLFWGCLLILVTPTIRYNLGARYGNDSNSIDLGLCKQVWQFLAASSVVYVIMLALRFLRAVNTLGRARNYAEARLETL